MKTKNTLPFSPSEKDLASQIRRSQGRDDVVSTILGTDDRVMARVTDGIYRQPASALRELISNAYDADATRVVIKTDAPRFDRITVEDNGNGMSPEVVAFLIKHIGGSAKRNKEGETLEITRADNPLLSPGGRRLIGKIGIGLFSVSQLTRTFQIITKTKNDAHRTIASVVLKQYSDDSVSTDAGEGEKFESGKVNIWREKAADRESQGTSIVLTAIRPQARDTLRSRELWDAIEQSELNLGNDDFLIEPPKYHIGRVDPKSGDLRKLIVGGSSDKWDHLPWSGELSPEGAFKQVVEKVWNELNESNSKPQLGKIFDYYLRMVWQLALAVPVDYVDGNLFDLDLSDSAWVYELSNSRKGSAMERTLSNGQTIRNAFNLKEPSGSSTPFAVFFDNLKLMRPIKFRGLPTTNHALTKPIVFIGKCREEFPGISKDLAGGPLSFEAYLVWTPKVAPTEHQGALIRIHGSSGTLFDPSFMRYQVAELTRLTQTTCEIFVNEGLDSALNIDRESFNYAHPHSVYITRWLHEALRQLATVQKKLASEARRQGREEKTGGIVGDIEKIVEEVWQNNTKDSGTIPPPVQLVEKKQKKHAAGGYAYPRETVAPAWGDTKTPKARSRQNVLEAKLKAIAQVLAAFGLLDALDEEKQEALLVAIHKILDISEE